MRTAGTTGALRLAVLGGSVAAGVGDQVGRGWVSRLPVPAGTTVYPLGIRGETSEQLRARWREEVDRRLPTGVVGHVLVATGDDDSALQSDRPRVDPGRSEENLASVVAVAAGRWGVLVVGPPPVVDPVQCARRQDLDRRFAGVCRDLGVPYLSVLVPLRDDGDWLAEAAAGDGAHPGHRGYTRLAGLVSRWPAYQQRLGWHPPQR